MFFFWSFKFFLLQFVGRYLFSLQIDRASAANLKRSKEEIEADKEEEDDFGYTTSEYFFIYWHVHDEAVEFFSAVRKKRKYFGTPLLFDRFCIVVIKKYFIACNCLSYLFIKKSFANNFFLFTFLQFLAWNNM